jgi:predicted membrane protein
MDINTDDKNKQISRSHSRVWVALTLMVVGGALLLQQLGFSFPDWLISWQVLLIVIGIFMGFNHGFRGGAWVVMIIVGSFFLIDDIMPSLSFHRFIWPFAVLAVGLMLLVRPRKHYWGQDWRQWKRDMKGSGRWGHQWKEYNEKAESFHYTSENYIDATTVFGGVHKTIVSKDFKGGDITVFMGGTEINLSQADINGVARLDITQIMGGTKLIVPAHWEVRSQMTSVFGNIEDKRQESKNTNPDKVLIIDGTSVFGGIEIRNF